MSLGFIFSKSDLKMSVTNVFLEAPETYIHYDFAC